MRGAVLLVLAVLLAGCARDAGTATQDPPLRDPQPPRELARADERPVWWTLHASSYQADTAKGAWTQSVTIPNGTRMVYVNVTFDGGAAAGFHMDFAGCALDFEGPVPGNGFAASKDCGGLYEGDHTLSLQVGSGLLRGTVEVNAQVCPASGDVVRAHCHRLP